MLTEQLTADAAALHQAILRHGGEVSPFFCGKELGWEHRRIARAMEELVAAGIIDPAAAVLPKPLKQRKTYISRKFRPFWRTFRPLPGPYTPWNTPQAAACPRRISAP